VSMSDAHLRTYVAKKIRANATDISLLADAIDGDTKISDVDAVRARDLAEGATITVSIFFPGGTTTGGSRS